MCIGGIEVDIKETQGQSVSLGLCTCKSKGKGILVTVLNYATFREDVWRHRGAAPHFLISDTRYS
jgi:hypothetical protein